MRNEALIVSVDRIEGTVAVLEADDGRTFEVPVVSFRVPPREGMIYRVPVEIQPLWARATHDHDETARRKAELRKRMETLKRNDAGGDVEL
jgi:hypothetical protein